MILLPPVTTTGTKCAPQLLFYALRKWLGTICHPPASGLALLISVIVG